MNTFGIVFLGMLGPTEIGIGILIIVILFGGKKIPELMKGLGKGMSEFKKARAEGESEGATDLHDGDKNKLK